LSDSNLSSLDESDDDDESESTADADAAVAVAVADTAVDVTGGVGVGLFFASVISDANIVGMTNIAGELARAWSCIVTKYLTKSALNLILSKGQSE
jgi:hypothetical protein